MIIHVVKPGESLYVISKLYGVSSTQIAKDNELDNPNELVSGQTLVILEGERQHKVAPGQTIYTIAKRYGITPEQLLAANPQVQDQSKISAGYILTIPPRTNKFGTTEVNGYAFPSTDMEVLRKTVPSLTYLSIFSYDVRPDGSLPTINDEPLINAARVANAGPIMVITNIQAGGGFNSDLARTILRNSQIQDTLINNVLRILRQKNYFGLDVDFEYIYPSDREYYNNFLRKIAQTIKSQGYQIITSLAPKNSAAQKGLLYEAHDYPVHGALTDHVVLMTYEWGYTYGPPMAVAPINEVRKVLNYAVTAIPRNKILMGMPNYGYDWTLPYVKGSTAKTVPNKKAVDLALRTGADIKYDEKSQSPYFNYYDANGKEHVVWFEDARSIYAKLKLANEFKVGGVSYWTIGKYFPQNWLVLNSLYNVAKEI